MSREWAKKILPRTNFEPHNNPGNSNSGGNIPTRLNRNRRQQEVATSSNTEPDIGNNRSDHSDEFSLQFSQRRKRRREERQEVATRRLETHEATASGGLCPWVGNSPIGPSRPSGMVSMKSKKVSAFKKDQNEKKIGQSKLCFRDGRLSLE